MGDLRRCSRYPPRKAMDSIAQATVKTAGDLGNRAFKT
jgi:hypothetical protein